MAMVSMAQFSFSAFAGLSDKWTLQIIKIRLKMFPISFIYRPVFVTGNRVNVNGRFFFVNGFFPKLSAADAIKFHVISQLPASCHPHPEKQSLPLSAPDS